MKLIVREIRPDEVEQEVTQRDQFNTDAVGLAEALVREAHQNSTDGESRLFPGAVRTRLQLVEARPEDADFWRTLLEPLRPHLAACDLAGSSFDLSQLRLLVIEDFGTTGLQGAIDRKDNGSFSDFWRRIGRSHKAGAAGGRWGLGKLVFSSSSTIRTFFGLTIREEEPARAPLLMGQAVLATHVLPGPPPREFAPHAFFARETMTGGVQEPETDPAVIAAFVEAARLARSNEPGLSIVIPFVHKEITPEAMLPHVIRNWFVPILTGRLVVEIGAHVLNSTTLSEIARTYGGAEFADGKRVNFITELHAAREVPPTVRLSHNWTDGLETALPASTLEDLRERFRAGHLIAVRAPLTIQPKIGTVEPSYIDLFLKADPEPGPGTAFFVRGSMSIPGEARRFIGRSCFGAMIAAEGPVATFLGDAEGPAHTSWSGTAEKVTARWRNPSARLREIRSALNHLFVAVARPTDRLDPDALLDHFNVRGSGTTTRSTPRKPVIRKPTLPSIPRRPAKYRIDQRRNGFVVRGTENAVLPLEVAVTMAYDVIDGNPLKEYSKYDFELGSKDIRIEAHGATYSIIGPNRMLISGKEPGFSVSVTGFDENRDLFVGDRKA